MKPILTTKRRLPSRVRLLMAFVIIAGLLAFGLGLHYSGGNRQEFPALSLNQALPVPVPSAEGGFSTAPVVLKLSAGNNRIYYTLDGSAPSLASELYHSPIIISGQGSAAELSLIPTSPRWQPPLGEVYKGTVLRAIAV